MKNLYILRHAKAAYHTSLFDDFDRPLETGGQQTVTILSESIREKKIAPEVVLCSPARRTRETLEGLQGAFPTFMEVRYEESLYLATRQRLVAALHRLDDAVSYAMVVGHNPGLEQLVDWLIKEETFSYSVPLKPYPPAGFMHLQLNVRSWGELDEDVAQMCEYIFPEEPQ